MSKLFSKTEGPYTVSSAAKEVMIDETALEMLCMDSDSMQMALEATEGSLERLKTLQGMQGYLSDQKLCSAPYLNAMQSYSPVVMSLSGKLGVKCLPSLEDFGNPYAAKDAHNYAMESFTELISKAWEKIKAFFRDFFKKIGLLLKRLVRANLDLESYEKYCDQLVAKLNANDAKITDQTPMDSDLPNLLAGKGDAKISSDYLLNQGTMKIINLLHKVDQLSMRGDGGKLHTDLVNYHKVLKAFIEVDHTSDESFTQGVTALQEGGSNMLEGMFKYKLTDPQDVPAKAFQSLLQHYDGKDIKSSGFTVWSIADPYSPMADLPCGVNVYLSHVNQSNFFITSSQEQGEFALKKLEPVSSLSNLVQLHKSYKDTLGKFNAKSMDKDVNEIADAVDKVLNLLQKDFAQLVQKNRPASFSYSASYLFYCIKTLIAKHGDKDEIRQSVQGQVGEIAELVTANSSDYAEVLGYFNDIYPNYADKKNHEEKGIAQLDAILNRWPGRGGDVYLKQFIDFLRNRYPELNQSGSSQETASRVAQLQVLNNFLVNLFLRIQSLYKSIATDFYTVLTKVRYAMIKYIYDSAKRYSY